MENQHVGQKLVEVRSPVAVSLSVWQRESQKLKKERGARKGVRDRAREIEK